MEKTHKRKWNNCDNKKIINGKEQIVEEEYHEQISVFAKIIGKRSGILLGYKRAIFCK